MAEPGSAAVTSARSAWFLLAAWVAMLLTGTSLPGRMLPHESFQLDKVVHFGLYFVFAVLLARAAVRSGYPARRVWLLVLAVSAFAAFDELHQEFIPGRDADTLDWAADTLGAATGMWAWARLLQSKWNAWLA